MPDQARAAAASQGSDHCRHPLSSLADDEAAVRRVIDQEDGPVLLVGHSWSAAVITEADNHPRVCGLIYIAAAAPDSGQSLNDWWQDVPLAPGGLEIKPYGPGSYVALSLKGFREDFAQDLPTDEIAA
jgi:pimeloyl-ACP methyl ester carboxylesterase